MLHSVIRCYSILFNFQGNIYRYDLSPKAPIITLEEARKIDCCLASQAFEEQEEHTVNMSDCGRRVVASLTHWCGAGGVRSTSLVDKCGAEKGGQSAFTGTVLRQKGTDQDLLAVLTTIQSLHTTSWKVSRVSKEKDYLSKCINGSP